MSISFSSFSRLTGRLAVGGLALLVLLTIALVLARNNADNDIVQRAASDLPLLKSRWPQFKKAVEELRAPIIATLAKEEPLAISSPVPELMRQITEAHSYEQPSLYQQGYIKAHIEVLYFERNSVSPSVWYWAPNIDTGLTATALHTRVSLQQLEQTELLTANGLMTGSTTPDALTNERRALVFFYQHTEWRYYELMIKILIRSSQIVALMTVILIALWVSSSTGRPLFTVMIVFFALLGLVIFSSLMLKALSLRTVLSMLITLQFGPSANRAVDYAGLSAVAGSAFGLLLLGLLHLPARPSCPECHRNVNEDYRYCPYCNFVLKRNCARCAAPVDTRWNYCPSCSEDI